MTMKQVTYVLILLGLLLLTACQPSLPASAIDGGELPVLFPDYREVTVPVNIAPLNFRVADTDKAVALFQGKDAEVRVKAEDGVIRIPVGKWHQLLNQSAGEDVVVTLYRKQGKEWIRHQPFSIHVSTDSIDSHLVYRMIPPAYRLWNEMGLWQRNLENFDEEALLTNAMTDHNCMNCHTFRMQSPTQMLFHQRSAHPGTYLADNGQLSKLNLNLPTDVGMRYMYWHPGGRYVVFSTNAVKQDYHYADPNRIEVFDSKSDVYVYDMERNEVFTDSLLCSPLHMETYPSFSPDGKRIFFCSADNRQMPEEYREAKYSLVSVEFDPDTRSIGSTADTLYNAPHEGRSAKFPRVSPDGHYLLYTVSDYGNFSIWHKDADLRMIDLKTLQTDCLETVNSDDTESYHSWSSNGRWFVFSSRRDDGSYTKPYFCHMDEQGRVAKPFLLPQQDPERYDRLLLSFNLPELIDGPVNAHTFEWVSYTLGQ